MRVIVDSGSSKADWIAIDEQGSVLFVTQSLGLNPEVLDEDTIIERLNNTIEILQNRTSVTHIYFYGAGCGSDRMKLYLGGIFREYFGNAEVSIYEDTYAAVFATTPKEQKAIVCILGTGSNCSYFDGEVLHQKVQSLGYIIMDDCSGNRFGRHLIRGYYYGKMPEAMAKEFETEFNMDPEFIKNKLYKEPNPNAYLATFARFLIKHKETDFCKKIIIAEIEEFVENHIMQFENYREVPVHFVGSVAYFLKEELQEVFGKYTIQLGNVLKQPIDGLIAYHLV